MLPIVFTFLAGLSAKDLNQITAVHLRIELAKGYDPFVVGNDKVKAPKKDISLPRKTGKILRRLEALGHVQLDWVHAANNGAWHEAFKSWIRDEFAMLEDFKLKIST